jgi:MraZ protein
MTIFTGEYDCKVDAKGRIMLPVAFRKQLGEADVYRFVIKNDPYTQSLELYTIDEWELHNRLIMNNINIFDDEHRQLIRDFRMGATEVECDPAYRILIPGRLLKLAEITTEALLSGNIGKIEIWSPSLYYNSGGDAATKRERAKRIIGNVTYNTEKS